MSNVIIRPYASNDRDAVRTICCDAADRGEPIENFFPDRELAADLLTGYYTGYEPESSFVAESDGRVVGYIQGCFDNRRYGLVVFWILVPKAIAKGFMHGVFFRLEFWRLAGGMVRNWRRIFVWRKSSFHSHQGHIHLGIARNFRGQQVGGKLLAALWHYAQTQGVKELTASVHDGNTGARRFFEHAGFSVREQHPMVMAGANGLEHYNSLYYVKNID